MSPHDYVRKRDLARSGEPDFTQPGGDSRAIFVVQLHHSSRRHFDFRLQVDDVLKSWAVPKGPSFDPKIKRLAVEVEDHPVAYADFEGDIKQGYGKGHVDLFDRGVWATQGDAHAQLEKGHLHFELFGNKLKGEWHLVRSSRKHRQPAWFLIKDKDRYAGSWEADDLLDRKSIESTRRAARTPKERAVARKAAASRKTNRSHSGRRPRQAPSPDPSQLTAATRTPAEPGFFKPQLARLRETPPAGNQWLHEVKWDGYRILATIMRDKLQLWSRNAIAWNDRLPEIAQALGELNLKSARLDGELIALRDGRSDFNLLQKTLSGEASAPLVYMLFDMPYLDGFDLSKTPLRERKRFLEKLIGTDRARLRFSSHWVGDGKRVFALASEQKLEGIVSKRIDSPYRAGRSDDWMKIKRLKSDEFAVIGYTLAKERREGFGSLLLAKPENKKGWRYAGRVGTGFSNRMLRELAPTLAKNARKQPKVTIADVDPLLRDARWVPPRFVAEVYYRGIGNHGLLRHPSLKTLRQDKTPEELRDSDRGSAGFRPRRSSVHAKRQTDGRIRITHPDRIVYPDDGVSKQDVADYYAFVMQKFLPDILDRPLSMVRCPSGISGACFFQKHEMAGLSRVGTVRLKEESGAQATYLYARDAGSIMELVQLGVLEFHPWGATIAQPDHADRVVFDLDPGEDVEWSRVVAAARLLRKLLDHAGLKSFVRTTGGKGLHVVLPLNPACRRDLVKSFTEGFAKTIAQMQPEEFVATSTKQIRGGRIFIDYLRNSRGATSVANYSLRARKGATVAMPLRWAELGRLKSGCDYDIHSARRRLARLRDDPWRGFTALKQNLDSVIRQLED
ncbi:MAG: DNA ligase D [Rhodanobacteraceae bacterium]